ncbi:MAG: hypothetical protein HQ509_12610 [Candidatus Marinimicrobia bacterium]|nr:hypothetical protein [Candidatus Neomarinimicrobiota bacterium]
MKLTPHEEKILELVQQYPEIVDDPEARKKIAEGHGLSEKTLRNRIADLKKYGAIEGDNHTNNQYMKKEINIIDFFYIIFKHKRIIIINFFVITLLTGIVSLLMPKTFQSTALLMPPSSDSGLGLMSSLSNLSFGNFNVGIDESSGMTFIAILKSRSMQEAVINEYNLIKYYKVDDIEEALDVLADNVDVDIDEEGTIRIITRVKTGWLSDINEELTAGKLAAGIANLLVSQLDRVNKDLKIKKAKFHRQFIEKRLEENLIDLNNAEEALKNFQVEFDVIALPEQTVAAINAAANVKAQIISNEIRLSVLRETFQSSHPDIANIEVELTELRSKLKTMEYRFHDSIKDDYNLFPVFSDVPDLGIQYARLEREVTVQNTLFIYITQQHEEAKIQEARDTPTIQVLDKAAVPIHRIRPSRTMMVYIAGVMAIMISVFGAFFLEYINKLRKIDIRNEDRIRDLKKMLTIDRKAH